MNILIVEDETELANAVAAYLEKNEFRCEHAANYHSAEDKLIGFEYDIIILDITLPDGNGLDLLKLIKQENPSTGILIVSARYSLDDKLRGLDLGADDYITKPFHLAELNSRINALIRRKKFNGHHKISFNEILINTVAKEVMVHDQLLELTRKEYELLLYLIVNKNSVLTRQSIAEHFWGEEMDLADNFDFIYTHIGNLRKKIKQKKGEDYIKTVYGLGYKFSDR